MADSTPDPPSPAGRAGDPSAALLRVLHARPDLATPILTALNRPVTDDHDLAQVLHLTTNAAVSWFPDAQWAGITVQFNGKPVTVADTGPLVLAVDQAQYDTGDGPCLHAIRTGALTTMDTTEVTRRWPTLGATATDHGVGSFLAAPLTGGGDPPNHVGSLNLYSTATTGFTNIEEDLVTVLSGLLNRALTEHTALRAAHLETAQLKQAMASRAVIEQAKGILMAIHQIDADAAFHLLRTESQNTNTPLRTLAADFVTAHTTRPITLQPGKPHP